MALPSPLFTILGRGARPKIAPSNDAYRELQFSLEPNRLYIALLSLTQGYIVFPDKVFTDG